MYVTLAAITTCMLMHQLQCIFFLTDLLNLSVVTAEKIFTTLNAEQDILSLFWKCEILCFAESIYFFNNQT